MHPASDLTYYHSRYHEILYRTLIHSQFTPKQQQQQQTLSHAMNNNYIYTLMNFKCQIICIIFWTVCIPKLILISHFNVTVFVFKAIFENNSIIFVFCSIFLLKCLRSIEYYKNIPRRFLGQSWLKFEIGCNNLYDKRWIKFISKRESNQYLYWRW